MKKLLGSCRKIMRFNTKRTLGLLLVLCTCMISFSYWSRCVLDTQAAEREASKVSSDFDQSVHFVNRNAKNYDNPVEMEIPAAGPAPTSNTQDIECEINREYAIQCRREDNEVYLPFSFLQNYFEVYGEIKSFNGFEKFEFEHSYSEVHQPPDKILPDGVFMSFQHYNVEIRKRVKCITAIEGVPISTQWEHSGHYYPIQIAQFGLSHYSKFLVEPTPESEQLLRGAEFELEDWDTDNVGSVGTVWDKTRKSEVVEFDSSDSMSSPGLTLQMKETSKLSLTLDIRFTSNGSISATVKGDGTTFHVHFVFSNTLISCDGKNIYYGLGESRQRKWIHLTRDINSDLLKGLALKCSKHRKTKDLTLVELNIRGQGRVDNLTLSTSAHMEHLFDAANWFVNHQDNRGGWPIMVTRRLLPDMMELPPGWYSAMAQGQAISTLVRAYLKSKNKAYLTAANDALKLFEISSAQGGVKARFANEYDWYEEYPTTPSSFVLNGFIFSLFGLYDLTQVTSGDPLEMAQKLYDTGMNSLKAMLMMYDSGFGTFYDLRHISVGIAPNRARWDYHTVHISQLLQLSKMDDDPLFPRTAKRWLDYMNGKRSPHN